MVKYVFVWLTHILTYLDLFASLLLYLKKLFQIQQVRVYIIILLGAITLYVFSYMKLLKYHCKKERDSWDHADVDAKAHRFV